MKKEETVAIIVVVAIIILIGVALSIYFIFFHHSSSSTTTGDSSPRFFHLREVSPNYIDSSSGSINNISTESSHPNAIVSDNGQYGITITEHGEILHLTKTLLPFTWKHSTLYQSSNGAVKAPFNLSVTSPVVPGITASVLYVRATASTNYDNILTATTPQTIINGSNDNYRFYVDNTGKLLIRIYNGNFNTSVSEFEVKF